MNKIAIIGRWTKNLDLTMLQNGAVAKGTIAVNRNFKKEGKPDADFFPVVIWGKQAENTSTYCGVKGNQVAINGRLETSNYENKEGIKVYKTEIIAEEVEFLESKKGNTNDSETKTDNNSDITPIDDGDIPF